MATKRKKRQLSPKQVQIIRDIRSAILDIMARPGKKPGTVMQIASVFHELADHFRVSFDRIISLGNKMIWAALYLLELQGWIMIDFTRPRLKLVRIPRSEHGH